MSRIDLHPDELFDALRAGRLDAADERRLRTHCAQCEACAVELAWAEAQLHDTTPDARDQARAQRALAALLGEPKSANPAREGQEPAAAVAEENAAIVPPRRRARRWQLGLAAAMLMLSGSSAAALWTGEPLIVHLTRLVEAVGLELRRPPKPPAQPSQPAPNRARAARAGRAKTQVPPLAPVALRAAPPPPEAAEPAVTPVAAPPTHPQPQEPSPEQLMRRAARLRARGDSASAADAYERVTVRFPRSRHAQAARVALGNLRLYQLRDAVSARAAFASYLQLAPQGPLSEEALSGLALAHKHLGEGAAEAKVWRRLLSAHPSSSYATGARRRLSELGEWPAQEAP